MMPADHTISARRYRAAIVGAGRMGGTIDDEVVGHPSITLPYSHAAAYAVTPAINLVAFADTAVEKARALAARYTVPGVYEDYREMIEQERPEILSICTRPGTHAEILEFACAHGVRAIYCEKPLCCSMEEADRIVAACEAAGTKFNLGTNRRFLPSYRQLREVIASGAVGHLDTLALTGAGAALWSHTHTSDLLLMLNGEADVEFVQGACDLTPADVQENRVLRDPGVQMGYFRFANGVNGFILPASGWDVDVHGSAGKIRTLNDMAECLLWTMDGPWQTLRPAACPEYASESAAARILQDLITAMETGGETQNPIALARRSQEMMIAVIESHLQGGARVSLPLANRHLYVAEPE